MLEGDSVSAFYCRRRPQLFPLKRWHGAEAQDGNTTSAATAAFSAGTISPSSPVSDGRLHKSRGVKSNACLVCPVCLVSALRWPGQTGMHAWRCINERNRR